MPVSVGLFGGTFDPVHVGHISLVSSFLKSRLIDEIWIILTPFPPHKEDREYVHYSDRKRMLELAFQDHDKVKISTIEKYLPKPSYTVKTIDHIQNKYPDTKFYLCIGEDSLANFDKWKDHQKILSQCNLLVAERPEVSHSNVEEGILEKAKIIEHTPVQASSSSVRSLISSGKDVKHLLPPEVYKYIIDNELYQ